MAIFLLIGLGSMPRHSFMYLVHPYTGHTCTLTLKAVVMQATPQESAVQALPQKQIRDL